MKKEYLLVSPFISQRDEVRITFSEFNKISESREFLLSYLSFEESLFQLLKCYTEFEQYLLSSALQFLHFPQAHWDIFQDIRIEANIRVSSVLNSVTSVKDQAPKIRAPLGGLTLRDKFVSLWENERVVSNSFSFAERLRNYAQHQTQPVSKTSTGGGWDTNRSLCEHHTSVYVDTNSVCENRAIPKEERERYLLEFGESADLSLILRETIGAIGRFVETLRNEFKVPIDSFLDTYEGFLKYEGKQEAHYDVVARENNFEVENISIFPEFLARVRKLQDNRYLKNNEKHFISNRNRGHTNSTKLKAIYK